MSWIALLVIVIGVFLALKAVGLVVRLLLWARGHRRRVLVSCADARPAAAVVMHVRSGGGA